MVRPAFRSRSLVFEQLETRETPAVIATFSNGILNIVGDSLNNNINVSSDNNGNYSVTSNGQRVNIFSSAPVNRNRVQLIRIDGGAGNDSLNIAKSVNRNNSAGTLASAPDAILLGGSGNDLITPLHGGFVGGQPGNRIVGNVIQNGGSGNDVLNSGFGNDLMIGGSGNDTLIWTPGTLNDVYEGGTGIDNAVVVGNDNNQGDNFVLSKSNTPGRVFFQRTNLVPFTIDINDAEIVTLRTQSGNDNIKINNLNGTDVQVVVVDGGVGNDQIDGSGVLFGVNLNLHGGDGNDTLKGGGGNDVINGGNGNDILSGNAGNDNLNGGKGSDQLLGGLGSDRLSGGGADGLKDVLTGESGADTFVGTVGESDVATDFNSFAGDVIRV